MTWNIPYPTGGTGLSAAAPEPGPDGSPARPVDRDAHVVLLGALGTDRVYVLRQAIQACRKGGTISVPGVYGGLLDKVPFGAALAKACPSAWVDARFTGISTRCSSASAPREIASAFIVSHRLPPSRAGEAYRMWNDKTDDCTKIVLDPAA